MAIRQGIAFPHRHGHELTHLRPLLSRLHDVAATPPAKPAVAVLAGPRRPVRGAWNVQVFGGLGGAALEPAALQRGWPRLRRLLGAAAGPSHRRGRYQELNAHGPRFADLFEEAMADAVVSRHGHLALNEAEGIRHDPEGPLAWMPTWSGRAPGGAKPSALARFAPVVERLAARVPVLVKLHPRTGAAAAKSVRRRLAATRNVTVAPADADPYALLEGARGLLTDASSLGFEAYCSGLPVAIVSDPRRPLAGLHAELAERAPVFGPDDAYLVEWAENPAPPSDHAWARDLLFEPRRTRNDAFAASLRARALERAR